MVVVRAACNIVICTIVECRCYAHTPQTISVSHELELSCDYDIISSGHFHYLLYDAYVMSVLLIPTTETISISGVIVSYMTHPSIMTQ
jgi:hypothetical protein